MKIALCNEVLRNRSFDDQCETLATLGYQGIEIAPYTISPDGDARRLEPGYGEYLLSTAQFYGLQIVGFHQILQQTETLDQGRGFHLASPDDDQRKSTLAYLKHLIDLCYAMEGTVVVWDSPAHRNLAADWSIDDSAHRAADLLREIATYAEERGITIAVKPCAHHETNFITSAREATILTNLVDHPHCRLSLDIAALSHELDPETPGTPTPAGVVATRQQCDLYMGTLAAHHRSRLAHFHASDPSGGAPGSSEVDHLPVAQALRAISYSGWVSVKASELDPTPDEVAQQALAFVKKTYGA